MSAARLGWSGVAGAAMVALIVGCVTATPLGGPTGRAELDTLVSFALSDDAAALTPYFEYTRALCTTEQGLGGPPKCLPSQHDGTPVNVLPLLGPEGSFLGETDVASWVAPRLRRLYAAYKVSEKAYSDENYPAGEYALVFVGDETAQVSVTLQVTQGRIVRIDYGMAWPPQIREQDVEAYILAPDDASK